MEHINTIFSLTYGNTLTIFSYLTGVLLVWNYFLLLDAVRFITSTRSHSCGNVRCSDRYLIAILIIIMLTIIGSIISVTIHGMSSLVNIVILFELWCVLLLVRGSEIIYTNMVVIDTSEIGVCNAHKLTNLISP